MESCNFQEWTRIGAANRLENGARLCAEHQPQHFRMSTGFEISRHAMALRKRCGWSFGHSRGPQHRFMGKEMLFDF
jgi:hypothetical protein